jgi:hypothetical protein
VPHQYLRPCASPHHPRPVNVAGPGRTPGLQPANSTNRGHALTTSTCPAGQHDTIMADPASRMC